MVSLSNDSPAMPRRGVKTPDFTCDVAFLPSPCRPVVVAREHGRNPSAMTAAGLLGAENAFGLKA